MGPLGGALTGILVIAIVYKVVQLRRCKLPPGPTPWPVVGNLLQIKPVSFRCFWEWSRKYGPIMSVWFGSELNVVVSSTELAKEVLKENDQQIADRPRSILISKFSRNGQDLIWADYGPHYVKVRKVCTLELFSPKRLEALRPIREDEVTAMVESIFNGCGKQGAIYHSVEMKKYLSAVAFNHITRIVFGKRFVNEEGQMDPQGVEFKEIRATGMKLGDIPTMALHIPYLRWIFPLKERAFASHSARRDKLTETIMKEHKLASKKSGAKQHFVDALLSLQEIYDLSEDNIIGLLWDMISAGMDTTSISVEWAMAELVRNPRVQEKAQEELDRVIGKDRVISEADFPQLP